MAARRQARQRPQQEGEHRQRQEEQHQRQRVVGHAQVGHHAQPGVEPAARGQPAQQRQEHQAQRKGDDDALGHVAALEVAQLMCQHRLDLVARQALQQRIEEDNALGRAEAGEIRIAVGAALAAVHHEQALAGKAAALHQGLDALA
jgi:hypothetical protein